MSDPNIDHSKKQPAFTAFHVRDGKDGHKGRWTEVGAAWATKDGKGLILHLNAIPVDGRVVLQPADKNR